jgi:hypothetical protein
VTVGWIGAHVVIGAFHSAWQLLIHILVFAVFAYVLFRRPAREYFARAQALLVATLGAR